MKVLKFGGTSVGSAENIKRVKQIVLSQQGDVVVVVSALGGITDKILKAAKQASTGTENFRTLFSEIKNIHLETVEKLFNIIGIKIKFRFVRIPYLEFSLIQKTKQIISRIL